MRYLITLWILIFLTEITYAETLTIRHIKPVNENDIRNEYFVGLLKLALEKTKDQGSYQLTPAKSKMVQERAIASLKDGQFIDVLWTMTSKERESTLLPVRIPLLKGLLGHRIFIINKGEESKFQKVNTIDDLKKLSAGQGKGWPDTEILISNGFKVKESPSYLNLFKMLQGKRFDYFPRGVNEPWAEVVAHKDKNLVIEETLLIQYPAPIYFFFSTKNTALAKRIEQGLWKSIDDGSFDETFKNSPANVGIFKNANIDNRKIFKINNPLLTPETPLNDTRLWYSSK